MAAAQPRLAGRWIAAGLAAALLGTVAVIADGERARASCAPWREPGTEVWLVLGQSNAGNSGAERFTGSKGVGTFGGISCGAAADPLPGASGEGGSVWTPLANRWVAEDRARRVLIVSRAEGATHVAQWVPGTRLFARVVRTVQGLRRQGLRVTRVLWHQGEADAISRTSGASYAQNLGRMLQGLREVGVDAPIYVALVGRCRDDFSPAVRAAQAAATRMPGVLLGPDTDVIGMAQRHERCHFDGSGQRRAAALWYEALAR